MSYKEKIRILFLITDFGKGGAERYLIDVCRYLQKQGEFDFKIGLVNNNNLNTSETKNFDVVPLDYKPFSLFKKNENLKYRQLLEDFKPQIIHTHRFLAEFLSSFYVNKKIKYICHCHDNMVQLEKFTLKTLFSKPKMLQFIEKQVLIFKKYQKIDTHFIANSEYTKKYFEKVLPKKQRANLQLIQLGFDFKKFYNHEPKFIRTGVPLKIINVGSFQPKKNQVFLIDIALSLKKRGIDFNMHLLGDGKEKENVQHIVNKNQLNDFIFLHGNVDYVEDWLKNADIYLHTAYYEPFGLVFLEAMAAGLPLVALDAKGTRDIIEQGKNGFMIYEQNPELFADALQKLATNKELYSSISEYAKKYASQFDMEIKMKELVDFYLKIINE